VEKLRLRDARGPLLDVSDGRPIRDGQNTTAPRSACVQADRDGVRGLPRDASRFQDARPATPGLAPIRLNRPAPRGRRSPWPRARPNRLVLAVSWSLRRSALPRASSSPPPWPVAPLPGRPAACATAPSIALPAGSEELSQW